MTCDRHRIGSRARSAFVGLPDPETYEYVKKRYSILVDGQRRGDCSRYARPKSVVREGSVRYLQVLVTRAESDGTICSGAFSCQSLRVDYKTNLAAYKDFIATPFDWRDAEAYKDPKLARSVCSLSRQLSSLRK